MEHVYLDYNASTPLRSTVIAAMTKSLHDFGNPSSIHKFGRTQRAAIEAARDTVAHKLDVRPEQVVFTSGGTEANNFAFHAAQAKGKTILVSAIEHESILNLTTAQHRIKVRPNGIVDLAHLRDKLSRLPSGSAWVSVMAANNQTGVIQPLEDIKNLCHEFGAQLHCDAIQSFAKLPFTYAWLGAHTVAISAHKIGGPKGVGALIVPATEKLPSFIIGGGQEKSHRAGTENVSGIVGFAHAIEDAASDDWSRVERLRDQMEADLAPYATIYGKNAARLPNTSMLGMPGAPSQKQMLFMDLNGIALSSGSACSSGKVKPSHVLQSMGVSDEAATEVLRVSLGWDTTQDDIDNFIRVWLQLYRSLNINEQRLNVK